MNSSTHHTDEHVLSVTELNTAIRSTLQGRFGSIWVGGEISDLSRPQSGHVYLTLKDGESQIRAVAWRSVANRLQFALDDGMDVVCEGYIDVYPPRGSYQLIVRKIQPLGMGALQLALIQLREKLAEEGLFDPRWKKPLPGIPRHVAVVTSPTSAAVHDFLEVLRRRWPLLEVTIVPTRVQGVEAVEDIVLAVRQAQQLRPDVLVLTRGGGSLEDLWCFNDERVVRAIHSCDIPVVSAIGHEIDVTLCDLVADVRALTPTEAAERIAPDRAEVLRSLVSTRSRLQAMAVTQLQNIRSLVVGLEGRPCLARPWEMALDRRRALDDWQQRMSLAIEHRLDSSRDRLAACAGKLESLSPLAVLSRGYSVTQRATDAGIIRRGSDVSAGDRIVSRVSDAQITSRVEGVRPVEAGSDNAASDAK